MRDLFTTVLPWMLRESNIHFNLTLEQPLGAPGPRAVMAWRQGVDSTMCRTVARLPPLSGPGEAGARAGPPPTSSRCPGRMERLITGLVTTSGGLDQCAIAHTPLS
jgi:hypothetical protein